MSGDTLIPIWGNAPSSIAGFKHTNVVRMILDSSSSIGTVDSISFDTQIGKTYSCSYSVKIPSELNIQRLNLQGFVLDYNPDQLYGKVLNAIVSPLRTSITSIDELPSIDQLSIVPQPATDNMMITGVLSEGLVNIEIHSLLGIPILKESIHHSGDAMFVYQQNVSMLPAGMYMITLHNNGKSLHQTIRIVR